MKLKDKVDYANIIAKQSYGKLLVLSIFFIVILSISIAMVSVINTINYEINRELLNNYHKYGIKMTVTAEKDSINAIKFKEINDYAYSRFTLNTTNYNIVIGNNEYKILTDDLKNLNIIKGDIPYKDNVIDNSVWVSQAVYDDMIKKNLINGLNDKFHLTASYNNKIIKMEGELKGITAEKNSRYIHIGFGSALSQNVFNNDLSYIITIESKNINGIEKEMYSKGYSLSDNINGIQCDIDSENFMTALQKRNLMMTGICAIILPIVLLLLILLCYSFLNTFNVMINRNKYFVGVNRAIGMNNSSLAAIFVIIAGIIILITVPIGYALSYLYRGFIIYSSVVLKGMFGGIDSSLFDTIKLINSPISIPVIIILLILITTVLISIKLHKFSDKKIISLLTRAR